MHEMFGSGTAALVSPICQFTYKENVYSVPIEEENGAGKLTQRVLKLLSDV